MNGTIVEFKNQFEQHCEFLPPQQLIADFQELLNSHVHLHQSTTLLLREDPTDMDYQEAIRENKFILIRSRIKLEIMWEKLMRLGGVSFETLLEELPVSSLEMLRSLNLLK